MFKYSHESPIPSKSASSCPEFGIKIQLSALQRTLSPLQFKLWSGHPSKSLSGAHIVPSPPNPILQTHWNYESLFIKYIFIVVAIMYKLTRKPPMCLQKAFLSQIFPSGQIFGIASQPEVMFKIKPLLQWHENEPIEFSQNELCPQFERPSPHSSISMEEN